MLQVLTFSWWFVLIYLFGYSKSGDCTAVFGFLHAYTFITLKKTCLYIHVLSRAYFNLRSIISTLFYSLSSSNKLCLLLSLSQLCKIDSEGKARKVVGCSCVVVKVTDWFPAEVLQTTSLFYTFKEWLALSWCLSSMFQFQDYGEESEGLNIVQEYVKSH